MEYKFKIYNIYKYLIIPIFMLLFTGHISTRMLFFIDGQYILGSLYLFLGIFTWYKFFTSTYEITIDQEKYIYFKSIIRIKKIHPNNIESVKENFGLYSIKLSNGEITVMNMMNDFDKFKSYILRINPDIKKYQPSHRGFKY